MTDTGTDRAAAVRQALRGLIADRGFHGASMSAVAAAAGVATGTAYTYYASKDDLVLAAYAETKRELGEAATANLDPAAPPRQRFRAVWLAAYRHLAANRDHARFLLQVDDSPYLRHQHEAQATAGDQNPILAQAATPDMAASLLPLPQEVLYELGLAPAVRLAAGGIELEDGQLGQIAEACWRAVSRPG